MLVLIPMFYAIYLSQQLNAVTKSSIREASETFTSSKTSATSITEIIMSSSLPFNSELSQIKLPSSITTIIIDIGARNSDYLRVLETTEDESVALLLFDPLPDSNIPLSKRVAEYSIRNTTYHNEEQYEMHAIKSRQVFLSKVAVGESEGLANFNIALGAACSSILETSSENKFWCANVKEKIQVPIVTLANLIPMIPDSSSKQIHMKIDTEGADLAVLRGAGNQLNKVKTVIIECNSDKIEKKFRDGECIQSEAISYMESKGFQTSQVKDQGDLVNIMFLNSNYEGPFPSFLMNPTLEFNQFYQHATHNLTNTGSM